MADQGSGLVESPPETAVVRVLLVEDTPINQKVATRQLEKLGCRVDAASTGTHAIVLLQKASYDLVLMDCQMPEMDGYTATRVIRGLEEGKRHTPIIAMTASATEADRDRCLAAGMDDYVTKPVREAELALLLEKWVKPAG
jgi:CheY-like chemotaxis protein